MRRREHLEWRGQRRRRRDQSSHWPPAQSAQLTALLGGVNRRLLTKAQREEIAALIEDGWAGQELRARVARVIARTEGRGQANE